MAYVGRLAPSPTGRIHLGIARTSLLAWLDARARNGRLLLRIEDIDRTRCQPEATAGILEDLRWLGLDWDHGPYIQSQRETAFTQALAQLSEQGRVYPCTCSRKEILRAASAPHGPQDEGPRYPETCRAGARPKPGRTPAQRLRTEPGDHVAHDDRRLGDLSQDVHAEVGDFVIQRSDGHWAYQLAVAVDDAAQGVTCIVRGDDLAGSTARQLLLRRLLFPDLGQVETLHVPLMRDGDGVRIAKRTGGHTIVSLREAGETPAAIIGRLAASVGLVPSGLERRPEELLDAWAATGWGQKLQ